MPLRNFIVMIPNLLIQFENREQMCRTLQHPPPLRTSVFIIAPMTMAYIQQSANTLGNTQDVLPSTLSEQKVVVFFFFDKQELPFPCQLELLKLCFNSDFLYSSFPSICWQSAEAVDYWYNPNTPSQVQHYLISFRNALFGSLEAMYYEGEHANSIQKGV